MKNLRPFFLLILLFSGFFLSGPQSFASGNTGASGGGGLSGGSNRAAELPEEQVKNFRNRLELLEKKNQPVPMIAFDHAHGGFSEVLAKSVSMEKDSPVSTVDYGAVPAGKLDAYLQLLSSVGPAQFSTWSKTEKLAFLLNAYNAFTIDLVRSHLKDKNFSSIRDIGWPFQSPWKISFFRLLGERMNLDHVEQMLIRKDETIMDARIHFALNCASIGCPALQPMAFVPEKIETQLAVATHQFLSDRVRNSWDPSRGVLHLSPIFDWYADDFPGGVRQFLQKHRAALAVSNDVILEDSVKVKIEWTEYDWNLNVRSKTR